MKIMIGVGHPKQVHIWNRIITELSQRGHQIKLMTSNRPMSIYLLDYYSIDYVVYGNKRNNLLQKLLGFFYGSLEMYLIALKFKPDFYVAGTPYLALVSKLTGKKHLTLTDTEHAGLIYWSTYFFTDMICTPCCFKKEINPKKHLLFSGYFELSYLSDKVFSPDNMVLNELGINENDKFIVIRLVAWDASHDIGHHGINHHQLSEFISLFEQSYSIFISSESSLPSCFNKYLINISPEKMHSLLYFSSMYIGEGGAMAAEAAILGTPSIYISSLAGTMGNFEELEYEYDLLYSFTDSKAAFMKSMELLQIKNLKSKWQKRRDRMLNDKEDFTEFIVSYLENNML